MHGGGRRSVDFVVCSCDHVCRQADDSALVALGISFDQRFGLSMGFRINTKLLAVAFLGDALSLARTTIRPKKNAEVLAH